MSDMIDPIDGLIRYVNEIKPFHSKVIEVLTEYVYSEELNITMDEFSELDVGIAINRVDTISDGLSTNRYGGTFDASPYDSARFFPVIAVNSTLQLGAFDDINGTNLEKRGYDSTTNRITLPGNQTTVYRVGRTVNVELTRHDVDTGIDTPITPTLEATIQSSNFITTGQTNGIVDNPRTVLILSSLTDERSLTLAPNERWSASVNLLPVDIDAVVISTSSDTNTGRIVYSTVDILGPGTLEVESYTPPANTVPNDGNVTTLDNYIRLIGDSTGSYPHGSTLFILLADGEQTQYTVSLSYFDGTNTIIELLEPLDTSADYNSARVAEGFFGYSTEFVIPTTTPTIPEGLTQTTISEGITFAWNDGNDEVINFSQFLIKETTADNTIILAQDGRDIEDFIAIGDEINIVEQDAENNGLHTVVSVTSVTEGTAVVVSTPINISSDTGFLETT